MILSRTTLSRLFHRLLSLNCCHGKQQQERGLYKVSFKRNSPKRMQTVTLENQYQRLMESAAPLSKFPYETQLEIKRCALMTALKKVVNIVKHNRVGAFTSEMEKMAEQNQGCICPLLDMMPSPKPEGFRNKEELNIWLGANGDPNTVGLMIGRGESGLCVPNDQLLNTKPLHNEVVKTFKSFLAQSKFKRRDPDRNDITAHWSKVLIRSNEQGHVMLVPDLSCRQITQEVVDEAKEELRSYYSSGLQMLHGVHSLFMRVRRRGNKTHHHQYHICGDTHIYEEVLGYKFRISPEAFFQLNTPGAEVLYSVVQNLFKDRNVEMVLDIGCGTGTIGVVTSSLVNRVIGLDVIKQAIEDAEFNADLNGVSNASFHVGSARALLKSFMADGSILTDETVAIVNPNRNGLNKKAILRLRCCKAIKHLIFISCKPHV
ncbi:tRNA (uracil-5-)-methyltransferase homolog B-like isoform X2 [Littorina saxatilis]|uniref:tRNA (uracil-5-)-methyltransferase homolog B-like isoform X2 n=1 Tax=Littorina saxatilis TaxID=31220 RepID=UPI0038B47485